MVFVFDYTSFFISFYSKDTNNDDTEVVLDCISGDFCVHVGKCLFLYPDSFHILAESEK